MQISRSFSIVVTALVLGSSLLFSSCEGPAGEVGPAGPQGATGAAGPQGATGATGQTGNANVIQITYAAKTWAASRGSAQQFVFPNITPAIMNSSAILRRLLIPATQPVILGILYQALYYPQTL